MKFFYDKELFHRYYKEILKNICLLLMISSLSVIAPLILRNAIDITLKDGFHTGKILIYLIVLTILYAIKFLYNRFRFWFTEKFKNEETRNLYQKIFHVSYNKINEMEPSYIAERVNHTVSTIFNLYCTSLTGIFVSAITVIVVLCMVTKINIELAILYFLQIPLQYFGFQKLLNGEKSRLSQYSYELQNISAKNNKNMKAVISDVNSIKQNCDKEGILSFISKSIGNITKMERKANSYAMDICTILEYISLLLKNSCFLYITYLFITGKAFIGDMIYLNLINDIYYTSIGEVINIQINLRDLHGAVRFVSEEIEANYEEDGNIVPGKIENISGEIKNIGYGDTKLITEGHFSFQKGDRIALTGDSGSGKSTFVKMLTKFLHCEGIKINGFDLKMIENRALRNKIFYLAQNSYLLPFSIKENITLGNTVPEKKWKQLLKMEFMQKFLKSEQGLDMTVYENGANLSGGDKQKIMLGRIFLQDPDVIILDESFNAIDEKSGEDIITEILALYADRIIIIISHSERYLKHCNKRVIIKNKKLMVQ